MNQSKMKLKMLKDELPPIPEKSWLKSTRVKNQRLMEKAGFVRQSDRGQKEWYDESRQAADKQTEYLVKLRKLRHDLINQENNNLNNALERIRSNNFNKDRYSQNAKAKRKSESGPESFPSRHERLVAEKQEKIRRHRKGRASPKLDPIEGHRVAGEPKDDDSLSTARDEVSSLPSDQILMRAYREGHLTSPLRSLLQPTSSIPNIGTRALRSPEKGLHLSSHSDTASSDSGTGKVKIYRKANDISAELSPRMKPLTRANKDELDLHPTILRYYYQEDNEYAVPTSTPVHSSRSKSDEWDQSNRHHMTDNNSVLGEFGQDPRKTPRRVQKSHQFRAENHSFYSSYLPDIEANGRSILSLPADGDVCPPQTMLPECHLLREDVIDTESNRRQIIVEMPSILHSQVVPEVNIGLVNSPEPKYRHRTSLVKEYRQNELRNREIKNLLEDVKELNLKTDVLRRESIDCNSL